MRLVDEVAFKLCPAREAQTCLPISAHFSLSSDHTPGSASCWKMFSICSGGWGISAATHHLSKVRKAPARYWETTGREIGGERLSAQRVERAGSIAWQRAVCMASHKGSLAWPRISARKC